MKDEEPTIGVRFTPGQELMQSMQEHLLHPNTTDEREYLCEVCGKRETLTEDVAYTTGWDYPPFIGLWGVVSPRTCPDCGIEGTAYWHVLREGTENIPANHMVTIQRIMAERTPE
jgi:hypothetical protein